MDCFWMYWMLLSLCTFKNAHAFLSTFFLYKNTMTADPEQTSVFLIVAIVDFDTMVIGTWSLLVHFWTFTEWSFLSPTNMPTAFKIYASHCAAHISINTNKSLHLFSSSLFTKGLFRIELTNLIDNRIISYVRFFSHFLKILYPVRK